MEGRENLFVRRKRGKRIGLMCMLGGGGLLKEEINQDGGVNLGKIEVFFFLRVQIDFRRRSVRSFFWRWICWDNCLYLGLEEVRGFVGFWFQYLQNIVDGIGLENEVYILYWIGVYGCNIIDSNENYYCY